MKKVFKREYYLQKIRPFYHSDLIKVITGIRRCGKSCLMLSVMDELRSSGVPDKDILYFNLDKRGYKSIRTPEQLEAAIEEKNAGGDYKYLFIDEIQNVRNFEEIVNAYREEGNFSIFITGSNSYLLSGELMTKLTGRYVEIPVFTLNFQEYLAMRRWRGETLIDVNAAFNRYIRNGGFPQTLEFTDDEAISTYLSNLQEQILVKDVKGRRRIGNKLAFDRVKTYVINNFGGTTNLKNIADDLRRHYQTNIKTETLKHYLEILEKANILYRCNRFDLKSRRSLGGGEKYYLADLGLYFATNTDARINYGPVLENMLYTYLLSHNYKVSVGKIGKLECDFIIAKDGNYYYAQVAMTVAAPETEEREYRVLEAIRDNYPKYLFTLDALLLRRNGIKHLNLRDFIADGMNL
ncbi:MAG: ATP-binding protein [Victivallaceae bacterium]|nr:ATP-binding protein [Victivallaceae bacterium]